MVVSCFASSLVNEMCMEEEIHQFPLHAASSVCIPSSHEYGCLWLHLLANIYDMLSCCLSTSCSCKISSVHYPDTPVLPSGDNVCSPYQNCSLQLAFPPYNSYTFHVPDNTIIKVIHKHNIKTVLLPLVAWGFLKLFWTFSISLPAFSPNPSNVSSRYPCVHDCPSTVVSALLPCLISH